MCCFWCMMDDELLARFLCVMDDELCVRFLYGVDGDLCTVVCVGYMVSCVFVFSVG